MLQNPQVQVNPHLAIEVEERLDGIKGLFKEFEDIQITIEIKVDDQEINNQLNIRTEVENQFYSLTSRATQLISKLNNVQNQEIDNSIHEVSNLQSAASSASLESQSIVSNTNNIVTDIKLPTIQLPTFDGSYNQWLEFRDTFKSLIHNNSSIGNVQKFHYLRASLKDEASQVIKALEFSEHNYTIAWDVLCSRYNNTRLLINNHIKSLFDIEHMQKASSTKIRVLIDTVSKHLLSLKSLHQPTEHWDTLIIHLITSKLDSTTAIKWEEYKGEKDLPTLNDLKHFLKLRADLIETLEFKQGDKVCSKQIKPKSFLSSHSNNRNSNNKNICIICKAEHQIFSCPEFQNLSPIDRINRIKRSKTSTCFNCLKQGHSSKDCKSGNCKRCGSKHNTLLHIETNAESGTHNLDERVSLSSFMFSKQVLLSTAVIQIFDKNHKVHRIRCLLDCGSQSSFITADLCNRLHLSTAATDITIFGLNNSSMNVLSRCTATIQSQHNKFNVQVDCYVVPEISGNLPNFKFNISNICLPKHLKLADPNFNKPSKIDMLIGADCFWSLICVGQINLGKNNPILQKTHLGWIVSGTIQIPNVNKMSRCHFSKDFDLQQQLLKFWEVEEIHNDNVINNNSFSKEEQDCEAHFLRTFKRDQNGRFIVSIPLKGNINSQLGDSKKTAHKQFLSLERKFRQNKILKQRYVEFLKEYEHLGHMSKVDKVKDNAINTYYMPHHGVIREDKETTKLRVVFNGSSPTSTGYSINDFQMVGPTIQQPLISILMRFRKHTYVISADIEKMYRQVLVEEEQRPLQRILFREDPSLPIESYDLNTVTYGTASASFLSIRCLFQLANEFEHKYPHVSKIIKNDFYVDDLLTGADSIEDAKNICKQVFDILNTGCFPLRKWNSNNTDALSYIDKHYWSSHVLNFDSNAKTLGLTWSSHSDVLIFYIILDSSRKSFTKRIILSEISQIFDPLGLLSPCTIIAKGLLQSLWKLKTSWDESLPQNIHTQWLNFRNKLLAINGISIPRHAFCINPVFLEMIGFSDASESAYGGCIYIRSVDFVGKVFSRLFCSKAKVSPLKTLTIPRLELCGALVLSRLADTVSKSLNISFDKCTFYCDSTIVLGWIKTEPYLLKTFISNRVAEIQGLTNRNDWFHVSSKDNPADLLSRGVLPTNLTENELWWMGPKWLIQDFANRPQSSEVVLQDLPEIKQSISVFSSQEGVTSLINKFSSFSKLLRVTSYILRFAHNCRSQKHLRMSGPIKVEELDYSLLSLIKICQIDSFRNEIDTLKSGKSLSQKSQLSRLSPFIHTDETLRVGGRLENSDLEFNKKHPILLSSNHHFTKLLFLHEHIKLMHCGAQMLLSCIREKYWPISGRKLAKRIIHNCLTCFKTKPRTSIPMMGNLPKDRLTPTFPFARIGVDYAGPLLIKDRKGRGSKTSKAYICLFICFVTKCVHIELVSELTKDAFIMTLRRFVARRGKPSEIFSDNGSNFVSANSELRELGYFLHNYQNNIIEHFENDGIKWHFIPPRSPHFGGLWEAGIKSTKYHLKRVAFNASLTFEELSTLLTQIEAILNSRPITPLSHDPNDLLPLTPAHFLIGRTLISLPDPDLRQIQESRLSKFQHIQRIQQHFWERWHKEYISELQARTKWRQPTSNVKEGTMVIIKDEKSAPMNWKIGRIIKIHLGKDNVCRVVTIRTSQGEMKRAVHQICPLPINS